MKHELAILIIHTLASRLMPRVLGAQVSNVYGQHYSALNFSDFHTWNK